MASLGGLALEPLIVTKVDHHHIDGLYAAEPSGLGDLGPGSGHLVVCGRSDAAEIGDIVLGAEVAPLDPGVGRNRPGVDHPGHRLQSGDDGKVGVARCVEGGRCRIDGGYRLEFGDNHAGKPWGQPVGDVSGEVVGMGGAYADEQTDIADQGGRHLVGHGPGLGLAVRWDSVLEVYDRCAGCRPGQLEQHLGSIAGSEQQAA